MNDVNHEAAGGRQSLTETIEAKLANPATSSELDLHKALNDVLADVGLTVADAGCKLNRVAAGIAKNFAVLQRGRLRLSGFLTCLLWALVDVMLLPQLEKRLRVQTQWLWNHLTGQRSSRLIPERRLEQGLASGPG